MYPTNLDYRRPSNLDEAVDLLASAGPDAELLAGGHSLLPTIKSGLSEVDTLIDISRLEELKGVEEADGEVRIGGGTTYADVLDAAVVRSSLPHLTEAVQEIGDRQVRNAGTIGGNIAHADPAADLPAVVLASEATLVVQGPDGDRKIDAGHFFEGMYGTALADDEILTEIRFPALEESEAGAYVKREDPASGYAIVGVAALLRFDGDTVEQARVAANGAVDHAARLSEVEGAIEGKSLDDDRVATAAERAANEFDTADLLTDNNASAEYRSTLLESYTRRALTAATERTAAN